MLNEEIIRKLKLTGYNRESIEHHIENNNILFENYKDKTLNHSILLNCKIKSTIFDNASATGSFFRKCAIIDCSIVQTDFEFCNFYDSYFKSNSKVIASFNNSNFVNTTFEDINFEFCTFTSALFEDCTFKNAKIENSTLENAIFKNCIFINMDMSNMNMDYVELINPKMRNVTLPLAQIPYMFGGLKYILSTNDNISLASQNNKNISVLEFKEKIIPLLIDFWNCSKNDKAEYYFPLSNVYIANGDYNNAISNLREGLKNAVVHHDFRIIKFYCKLISKGELFNSSTLYNFYNLIKRFGTTNGNVKQGEVQSFIRNIGEIESALFSSCNKAKLFLRFKTNLSSNNDVEIGALLGKLFSFSKMKHSVKPNSIEISLTENSPIMVSIQVSGEAENIIVLIDCFLQIANIPDDTINSLNIKPICNLTRHSIISPVSKEKDDVINVCRSYNIHMFLMEYYIENCEDFLPKTAKTFCFFNNTDANIWNNHQEIK